MSYLLFSRVTPEQLKWDKTVKDPQTTGPQITHTFFVSYLTIQYLTNDK